MSRNAGYETKLKEVYNDLVKNKFLSDFENKDINQKLYNYFKSYISKAFNVSNKNDRFKDLYDESIENVDDGVFVSESSEGVSGNVKFSLYSGSESSIELNIGQSEINRLLSENENVRLNAFVEIQRTLNTAVQLKYQELDCTNFVITDNGHTIEENIDNSKVALTNKISIPILQGEDIQNAAMREADRVGTIITPIQIFKIDTNIDSQMKDEIINHAIADIEDINFEQITEYNQIDIEGEKVNISTIDEVIAQNPNTTEKYRALQLIFNEDGTRKNLVELVDSTDSLINQIQENKNRSEENKEVLTRQANFAMYREIDNYMRMYSTPNERKMARKILGDDKYNTIIDNVEYWNKVREDEDAERKTIEYYNANLKTTNKDLTSRDIEKFSDVVNGNKLADKKERLLIRTPKEDNENEYDLVEENEYLQDYNSNIEKYRDEVNDEPIEEQTEEQIENLKKEQKEMAIKRRDAARDYRKNKEIEKSNDNEKSKDKREIDDSNNEKTKEIQEEDTPNKKIEEQKQEKEKKHVDDISNNNQKDSSVKSIIEDINNGIEKIQNDKNFNKTDLGKLKDMLALLVKNKEKDENVQDKINEISEKISKLDDKFKDHIEDKEDQKIEVSEDEFDPNNTNNMTINGETQEDYENKVLEENKEILEEDINQSSIAEDENIDTSKKEEEFSIQEVIDNIAKKLLNDEELSQDENEFIDRVSKTGELDEFVDEKISQVKENNKSNSDFDLYYKKYKSKARAVANAYFYKKTDQSNVENPVRALLNQQKKIKEISELCDNVAQKYKNTKSEKIILLKSIKKFKSLNLEKESKSIAVKEIEEQFETKLIEVETEIEENERKENHGR